HTTPALPATRPNRVANTLLSNTIILTKRNPRLSKLMVVSLFVFGLICWAALVVGLGMTVATHIGEVPTLLTLQPPTGTTVPPTASPPPIPPTTVVPPTAISQAAGPPTDRFTVPQGSERLGEFTVEQYCNSQGYGVILVNNQTDWA